jgi:hypothetical protein
MLDRFLHGCLVRLNGEDLPDFLTEEFGIVYYFRFDFIKTFLIALLEEIVEPETTNSFVAVVEFTQIDEAQILLGKPTIVDHN